MRRFVNWFDQVVPQIGKRVSRRRMMQSLAGGAAAPLLAGLGVAHVPAAVAAGDVQADRHRRRRRCKKVQQTCTTNRQCCPSRSGRLCLNNGCGGGSVCCSPAGGRCAVHCDCCGGALCNFQLGVCQ